MKNFLFFLLIFSVMIMADETDKNKKSCCAVTPDKDFAAFASDSEFRMKHDTPAPFVYESDLGSMITMKSADGTDARAFFIEAKKKSNKYLIVIHEWWGLNDHIKNEAAKLYNDLGDVNVLALDMYDGKVTSNRDSAGMLMQSLSTERAMAIINAALNFTGKNAKVATIGWCMGGGFSLQAAIEGGSKVKGSVIYYGMPEKDVTRLKKLKAEVLGIFASRETWISPAVVDEFKANMKKAGKKLSVTSFDAEHAFANPSNPNYNSDYTAKAYGMSLDFIKRKLK